MSSARPPRIVITGMYRSGSTRLFNVIREALLSRYPLARSAHYGKSDLLEEALENPAPGIFKEHVLSQGVIERVESGEVQAVATLRPPLASMVSLCATFSWPPDIVADLTDQALTSLERMADVAKIYTYETATDCRPAVIRGLLSDVGLPSTWVEASRLSYRWSRRNALKYSEALLRTGDAAHDPVTLFHPGHIGRRRGVDASTLSLLRKGSERRQMDARVAALESRAR